MVRNYSPKASPDLQSPPRQYEDVFDKLAPILSLLEDAQHYADLDGCSPWEFAVEIEDFYRLGFVANDLRFLVRRGLVEHQYEIDGESSDGRCFHTAGDLSFAGRSCFVLRSRSDGSRVTSSTTNETHRDIDGGNLITPDTKAEKEVRCRPVWDAERRILSWNQRTVKQFKWHAINQETVLAAFEEEGWRARIDDPLSPHPEQDSKRRLSDTIKCLNRKQQNRLVHFRGDGTGEGIVWETVQES